MSLDLVQRALMEKMTTVLEGVPTAFENQPFVPPEGKHWAQVHFVPNLPVIETLGDQGQDLVNGFVQVDLNYPPGTGSAQARQDFERIRAALPGGSRLRYDGQEVVIRNVGRSQGRILNNWYRVHVTVSWYALIPR